jgi:hypothetical protein
MVFLIFEVLSAEQPRIDRPRAWSDHCQSGAKGRQHDGNPWIAGVRESDVELNDGD